MGLPLCRLIDKMIVGCACKVLKTTASFPTSVSGSADTAQFATCIQKKEDYGKLHMGCSTKPTGIMIPNNPTLQEIFQSSYQKIYNITCKSDNLERNSKIVTYDGKRVAVVAKILSTQPTYFEL